MRRQRRRGVPIARDVDRRSAGPRHRRGRIVCDAQRERDDPHHFAQRRIAKARFEWLRLCQIFFWFVYGGKII